MIVIGEKINSTRKSIRRAIADGDVAFLQGLAREQVRAGADYLDVNTGAFPEKEAGLMEWLVRIIQEAVDSPLVLDSASPAALESGLRAAVAKSKAIINSVTAEDRRFKEIVPLAVKYDAAVLALSLDDSGISKTAEGRFAVARGLIEALCAAGIPQDRIFLDPVVQPISVQNDFGLIAIEVIRRVKEEFPEVKTTCGLSNISFGLPERARLNRCFLSMAIAAGLDSAILDPLDCELMEVITASEALAGKDRFCKNYIRAFRRCSG